MFAAAVATLGAAAGPEQSGVLLLIAGLDQRGQGHLRKPAKTDQNTKR